MEQLRSYGPPTECNQAGDVAGRWRQAVPHASNRDAQVGRQVGRQPPGAWRKALDHQDVQIGIAERVREDIVDQGLT